MAEKKPKKKDKPEAKDERKAVKSKEDGKKGKAKAGATVERAPISVGPASPAVVVTAPPRTPVVATPKVKLFPSPSDVHLLVVDDEPEVLNLLVPFLRRRGYTVSEAEDGDQALEKILTDRPNIVLLDVMMPGLNGWEISQYVRDRVELDPVRIIMATGIGQEMNAATAPLYGADAYIDKPFRLDDVDRTVQDVIQRIESGVL